MKKILIGGLIIIIISYIGYNVQLKSQKITEKHQLNKEDFNVLLYSKTNGWNHKDAITSAKNIFKIIAKQAQWKLIIANDSTLFTSKQLEYFDVVIWNNVTGRTLNDFQREAFKSYLEQGGGYVGIHGAGDSSQDWDWYENELVRARFSHHPNDPQFQIGKLNKECTFLFKTCEALPQKWIWEDEWYVFYNSPRNKGTNVLYTLDETNMLMNDTSQSNKNWGMGEDHPVIWYHYIKKGKAFYTALGHKGVYFENQTYQALLKEAVHWAGNSKTKLN